MTLPAPGARDRRPVDHPTATPRARRTDTRDPHHARQRALRILFQAELRQTDPLQVLQQADQSQEARRILDDGDVEEPAGIDEFTASLVTGAARHRVELDELIQRHARRWQISRMPVVDRVILRLATYELRHESTAPAVVIDEAIGFAKAWSTDDSGRYVNGVLEAIRKSLETDLSGDAQDEADGDAPAT